MIKAMLRFFAALIPECHYVWAVKRYRYAHGKTRLFIFPRTFNELIIRRKLYERNPLLTLTADKYLVRDYVKRKVGDAVLIPLYAVSADPGTIDFGGLPKPFVVKSNHGSGFHLFVRPGEAVAQDAIVATAREWLATDFSRVAYEWPYRNIRRKIVVEKMLTVSGEIPNDYRFYVLNGKVRLILASSGRLTPDMAQNLFDEDWRALDVAYYAPPPTHPIARPDELPEMIRMAELLGQDFAFVRVDLYLFSGQIYFSELTHYPNVGLLPFKPPEFDRALGDLWRHGTPIPERCFVRLDPAR